MQDSIRYQNIRPLPPRLPAAQFWGLVVGVYFLLQLPFVRIPVLFLSTWAHEFGHGLGALVTGGSFRKLQVLRDFSGVATTATTTDFQRVMVIVFGLLGPSLLGVVLLFLTRALNWYRVAIILLAALLVLSQLWAADLYTRGVLAAFFVAAAVIAWKVPAKPVLYIAHIVAIALCLNALTGFGYFFMGNAEVAGRVYQSDTGVLASLLGGPYWLWGGIMVAASILLLALGVFVSDRWARSHDRA